MRWDHLSAQVARNEIWTSLEQNQMSTTVWAPPDTLWLKARDIQPYAEISEEILKYSSLIPNYKVLFLFQTLLMVTVTVIYFYLQFYLCDRLYIFNDTQYCCITFLYIHLPYNIFINTLNYILALFVHKTLILFRLEQVAVNMWFFSRWRHRIC